MSQHSTLQPAENVKGDRVVGPPAPPPITHRLQSRTLATDLERRPCAPAAVEVDAPMPLPALPPSSLPLPPASNAASDPPPCSSICISSSPLSPLL